jgi:hypothetical protein
MGSVASTNAGLADLMQNLTSASSPLASELSSPAMQAALESAPPGDIVQLSNEALQLQEVGTLFGDPSQTNSAIDPNSILAALYPSSFPSTTSASTTAESSLLSAASAASANSTSSATLANDLASYQYAQQSNQVEALFGTTPTTTSNSFFNVLG